MSLFGPPNVKKLEVKKNVKGLIKALRYKYSYVRKEAAEALGKLNDARAVEPLINTLGDAQSNVRQAAAEALVKLGAVHTEEPLIKALKYYWDKDDRQAAAKVLGKLGDARAVEPLIKALGDSEKNVRQAAAEALGELADARAIDPLFKMLEDKEECVSLAAALALDKLGDARAEAWLKGYNRAVKKLIKNLSDHKWDVRKDAAISLIRCAVNNPKSLLTRWTRIKNIVESPHRDSHHHDYYSSNDCRHTDSPPEDSGIGLTFPDKPKNLDF